jgi:hypothetical protein
MKVPVRPGWEILGVLVLVGLVVGWIWWSAEWRAERTAAEVAQMKAYEGLLKDSIQALSEGAERLRTVPDPAARESAEEIGRALRRRLKAILAQKEASPLPPAKKAELDRRYHEEMDTAWNRWTREHLRISELLSASGPAARRAVEKGLRKLAELWKNRNPTVAAPASP